MLNKKLCRNIIKFYREKTGTSMGKLSKASGVSKSTISCIESGRNQNPGFITIITLLNAMGIKTGFYGDITDCDVMEREEFVKIVSSVGINKLISAIENEIETERFKFWMYEDEVYILDKLESKLINWYKLHHIGRCLYYNMKHHEVIEMFQAIKDEI